MGVPPKQLGRHPASHRLEGALRRTSRPHLCHHSVAATQPGCPGRRYTGTRSGPSGPNPGTSPGEPSGISAAGSPGAPAAVCGLHTAAAATAGSVYAALCTAPRCLNSIRFRFSQFLVTASQALNLRCVPWPSSPGKPSSSSSSRNRCSSRCLLHSRKPWPWQP